MKTLHDIFTPARKKIIRESTQPKEKIIVDYREKQCFVPAQLIKLGFEIEFKELKVADYIVKEIAIERKTVSDFLSSMINKRLINQLEELQQYKKKLLIIEGLEEKELYSDDETKGINPNAIRGFILSILLKHNIPIIYTKDANDTAKFISVLAKKKETENSIVAKKKARNQKEQIQFIIEGFPSIGPKMAKKILEEFKSIKNFSNATDKQLKNILGKKAESIKQIIDFEYLN